MLESDATAVQQQLRRLARRQRAERPRVDGLSGRAVQVLRVIVRAEAPVQPGTIATQLGMAPSNVATALRELESATYVSRSRDADDARRVLVAITAAGEAVVAASRAARAEWLRAAVEATLTPAEQEQLSAAAALLGRVAEWREPR